MDLVLLGGRIWDHPVDVDAVAVTAGVITAVGEPERAAAERAGEVVDLEGGALLPAFADGHMHPSGAARSSLGARVSGATTIDGVLDAVAAWGAANPDAAWIRGDGYDPTSLLATHSTRLPRHPRRSAILQ